MKKVSRIFDIQKNSLIKNNFIGVPDTDMRACFKLSARSPAMNMQKPPLGTTHLILGDSLVRVLQSLRTSWMTTVMAFGGAFNSPIQSNDGVDEPRKNSGHIDSNRHKQGVQELGEEEAEW